MSRWPVRISQTGGGPPPPPVTSRDRFAPKYLVGNTSNGDNATPYSSGGFYYIPDIGDGEGIRTALAYADASSPSFITAGDVWIRPGTYTLAAGALPLQIPTNVRVQGAGQSTIVLRPSTNQYCCVFALASESELRDVQISVFNSSATLLDQGVLVVFHQTNGGPSYLERVNARLDNNVDGQSFKVAAIRVINGTLVADRCEITVSGFSAGDPRISDFGVAGVRVENKSQAYFDVCKIDVATFFGASAKSPAVLSGRTNGQASDGGGLVNIDQCTISGRGVPAIIGFGADLRMTASVCSVISDASSDAAAVYLQAADDGEPSKAALCNNFFQVPGTGTPPFETYGIDVDVEQGRIVGNEILAANGIVSRNAAGKGVAIGFNNVTSQAGKHISVQPVDESAHNILSI